MLLTKKEIFNKYLTLTIIIIYIYPVVLISGPFLPDLFLSLISVFGLILLIFNSKLKILLNTRYNQFLILFWVYIFITSFFSNHASDSVTTSGTYFRFIIFAVMMSFALKENNNDEDFFKKFNYFLIIVLFVFLVDGYFQYFFGKNLLGFKLIRPDRLSGLFKDKLILGSYLFRILPIMIIVYLFNKKDFFLKRINLLIIILSIILIFLSGERSAFLLSCLFLLLTVPFIFSVRKCLFLILGFVLILLSLTYSSKTLKDRYINQFQEHSFKYKVMFPGHIGLWSSSISIFKENFIIGAGVRSFRFECHKNKSDFLKKINKIDPNVAKCATHPHNYYIQFLAETGILGFLFLIFAFIYFLIIYLKSFIKYFNKVNLIKKNHLCFIVALNGLITQIWPVTTTGNFFNNWLSCNMYFLIGFLIYFHAKTFKTN